MAWSAPSEWERWDPEEVLFCPYNRIHRIHAKRYQTHVIKCKENYPEKDFVSCPFNAKHIILRPELAQHITRCPDRREIEPYTYKGNEKDSEGFYFKGDTSVPCYKRETTPRRQEEDWDREDEETTSRQNLCEYYAHVASLPVGGRPTVQDVLSLNPTDREQFKRNMRTKAIQSHHPQHNHQNLTEQRPQDYNSSVSHRNRHAAGSMNREINVNTDIGRVAQNAEEGHKSSHNYSQNQRLQPWRNSNHFEERGDGQSTRFISERNQGNAIAGSSNQEFTIRGQAIDCISDNNSMPSRTRNRFLAERQELQGNHNPALSGTTYSFQNNSQLGYTAMDKNDRTRGGTKLGMTGVVTSTGNTSFKGTGRARLAEEARRMNFGLRRSGTPVGRGRGILDLYSNNNQG